MASIYTDLNTMLETELSWQCVLSIASSNVATVGPSHSHGKSSVIAGSCNVVTTLDCCLARFALHSFAHLCTTEIDEAESHVTADSGNPCVGGL